MTKTWGATRAEWNHFSLMLGLTADMLPAVADPGAEISCKSKLKSLGKTPSRYNIRGHVTGIAKWTTLQANDALIEQWSRNGNYSICLQTRHVRAIDIDVTDVALATQIRARLSGLLGVQLPARGRANSGRAVLGVTVLESCSKRVVTVKGGAGIVEFLADGQQFIACGTHPSGSRYEWEGGLPESFPDVTLERVTAALDAIEAEFGEGLAGKSGVDSGYRGRLGAGGPSGSPAELAGPLPESRISTLLAWRMSPDGEALDDDPVSEWLADRGWLREVGHAGESFIWCPFEAEHTGDSGDTETVYYPAGTGGYAGGHFKCLHAHCLKREDAQFLSAIGFERRALDEIVEITGDDDALFSTGRHTGVARGPRVPATGLSLSGRGLGLSADAVDGHDGNPGAGRALDDPTAVWSSPTPGQGLTRNKSGWIATVSNVTRALDTPGWWQRLGFDRFRDELMYCEWPSGGMVAGWSVDGAGVADQWQSFTDEDYTRARVAFDVAGFAPVSNEMVRSCVGLVARENEFDSAQLWLSRVVWDGVPRVAGFFETWCACPPGAYSRAVACYLWSALAGRVLLPGAQADMVPILVGDGGVGKTRVVEAIAPAVDFAARIDLAHADADIARKLRGKLVVEIAELRGLHARESNAIKDFCSATADEWIPKYREFATKAPRRFVMIGTTDMTEFLSDDAGNNRRWLPVSVGQIDVEGVRAVRDQLWAEGRALFESGGVRWPEAQALGKLQHAAYEMHDSWQDDIEAWMQTQPPEDLSTGYERSADRTRETWGSFGFTSAEALKFALGLPTTSITRAAEMRVAKILRGIKLIKKIGSRRNGKSDLRTWHEDI